MAHTLDSLLEDHADEQARQLLHTLKGVAGNLGAVDVQAAAHALERAARAEDSEAIAANLQALTISMTHVAHSVDTLLSALPTAALESDDMPVSPDNSQMTRQEVLGRIRQLTDAGDVTAADYIDALYVALAGLGLDQPLRELEECLTTYDFAGAQHALHLLERILAQAEEGQPL